MLTIPLHKTLLWFHIDLYDSLAWVWKLARP
jgi:hypothetical protein